MHPAPLQVAKGHKADPALWRVSHLGLGDRTANEDDHALALVLVLAVLEGQLGDLDCARQVVGAVDVQVVHGVEHLQVASK